MNPSISPLTAQLHGDKWSYKSRKDCGLEPAIWSSAGEILGMWKFVVQEWGAVTGWKMLRESIKDPEGGNLIGLQGCSDVEGGSSCWS